MIFFKVLAASLQELLDYEGDVENEMMCTFSIGYTDMFGCSLTKELKENGAKIAVNNDNRRVNSWTAITYLHLHSLFSVVHVKPSSNQPK